MVRDWGYAPEYMDAVWRALQQELPDDFVIATGESHPLGEFVKLVFHKVGLEAEGRVESNPAYFRPSEVRALYADASHAAARLGWTASTRLAGLAAIMVEAELRSNPR